MVLERRRKLGPPADDLLSGMICRWPEEDGCKGYVIDIQENECGLQGQTYCELHMRLAINKARLRMSIKRPKVGYVYYVLTPLDTIKIGFSTKPSRRWHSLTQEFGDTLTPLALVAGTEQTEQDEHLKFDDQRIYTVYGEQFRAEPPLTDYIQQLPTTEFFLENSQKYLATTRTTGKPCKKGYRELE